MVFRRRIVDITAAYLDDLESLLNKFIDKPIKLLYLKGDIKQGICDVKMVGADEYPTNAQIRQLPIFFRIIGLSVPKSRIKSLMLKDVKYMFMDEFICDMAGGESYLSNDEYFLLEEIYTTFNREASTPIRILAAGNPYSLFNPYFMRLEVPTTKLKPGAFIVGKNYVINCFEPSEELKAAILAHNPTYQFDDAYAKYAFNGEAINDANIKLLKCEPKGFKLMTVFKLGADLISIHKGSGEDFKYWCCKHNADWLQKTGKRKIIAFNFADMVEHCVKFSHEDYLNLSGIATAMDKQEVKYNCIDASYMLQEVYPLLPR